MNRREIDCSGCDGTGKVTYGPDHELVKRDFTEPGTYVCSYCGGSGKLDEEIGGSPMTLQQKAEAIAAQLDRELRYPDPETGRPKLAPNESVALDLVTISIILTILIELIRLYMRCNSEAGAVKSLASPSWWQRLLLKRVVRRNTRQTKLDGCQKELESSIITSGQETTVNEMRGFYLEVRYE